MKPIIKKISLIIGLIVAGLIIYYAIVIIRARIETPQIVQNALASRRIKLQLSDLNSEQINALLKVQDPGFYHHQGYDFPTPGTGLTTISQALVKIYYFDHFTPGLQKIKQTLITRFAFDPLTPKDTILKLFINEVYLGHQGKAIHGFEHAANVYFHKRFRELNQDEYLAMVAMIRAPDRFHCIKRKKANIHRVKRIKRMLAGYYKPEDNSDWLYDRM